MRDVVYAVRSLVRTPGFTVIAVITLALGMGANTAIFSLLDALVLQPPPFHDPEQLVAVWDTYQPQYSKLGLSPVELDAWRRQSDLFVETAWYRSVPLTLALANPGQESAEVKGTVISPQLLPMLGATPAVGRGFAANEPPQSVLLSHRLWQTRFAGNAAIAGQVVRLNGQPFTVAGVMLDGFQFPEAADLWLAPGPLMNDELTNPVRHALGFLGRLRPAASLSAVSARIPVLGAQLAAAHPKTSTGFGMTATLLPADLSSGVRPALLLLFGAVVAVWLIACANVANLLLSRANGRAREIALRFALGATAGRILRQLLTESLVLGLAGGAAGLLLAQAALAFSPVKAPLDGTVLAFLTALSVAAGILFGLAPASHLLRPNTSVILKTRGSRRFRDALVIAEFAMALVLAAGAGLLAKSFVRMLHVDPGFRAQGLLTLRLSFPPTAQPGTLFKRIEDRVRELPGVQSVAATNILPLLGDRASGTRFHIPGSPFINPDALPSAQFRLVTPGYFPAMGIPVRSGRGFTERDLDQPVVVINETMARRFWPGEDPVGRKFVTGPWGPNPSWSTIVGVAGDVRQFGLDGESSMDLYIPTLYPKYLIIQTEGNPLSLAGAVRQAVHAVDTSVPVSDMETMEEIVAHSSTDRRRTMLLLDAFAGLALVLAFVGIYGVMSGSVAQRTREIGIRMALGADMRQVRRMVVRQGISLAAAGTAIGLAGAFAARRLLASFVFDVSPSDPQVYGAVALLMLAVATLACYWPARRASRIDPSQALRWE